MVLMNFNYNRKLLLLQEGCNFSCITVYIVNVFTIKYIVELKIRKKKNAAAFFDFNNPNYKIQLYGKGTGCALAHHDQNTS